MKKNSASAGAQSAPVEDVTLVMQTLDWLPGTPLLEGVTRTASHFETLLQSSAGVARAAVGGPKS